MITTLERLVIAAIIDLKLRKEKTTSPSIQKEFVEEEPKVKLDELHTILHRLEEQGFLVSSKNQGSFLPHYYVTDAGRTVIRQTAHTIPLLQEHVV
jgi:DNA-binding PadR family transcriptional regulator